MRLVERIARANRTQTGRPENEQPENEQPKDEQPKDEQHCPGHPGHAHPENPGARADARVRHRRPHRADQKGVFQVNAGSLFPAFRRLERDGLIKGEWEATENNRRAKYDSLTPSGRAKLKRNTQDWEVQTTAIARILRASLGEL